MSRILYIFRDMIIGRDGLFIPELGLSLFLPSPQRLFPISLSSLSRLKLSQICEDFYSENLGSEDLVSEQVFYYALIGHLSKILI